MHDLRPARQRSGDRLREERDIERIAAERIVRRLPAPQIDQIHDVMKGEERNAEWQRKIEVPKGPLEQGGQVVGDEVGVLEDCEHREIADDCPGDETRPLGRQVRPGREPVHRDRQDQEDDKRRVPIAVEDERKGDENADARPRMRIGETVNDECGRQEDKQKRIVVEQHRAVVSKHLAWPGNGSIHTRRWLGYEDVSRVRA